MRSDKAVGVTFTDADGLAGRFIRELVATGAWAQLEGGDKAILGAMCSLIDAGAVTERGEPVVAPSMQDLQRLGGVGRFSARQRTHALEERRIIRCAQRGVGNRNSVYILHFAAQNIRPLAGLNHATASAIAAARSTPQIKNAPRQYGGAIGAGGGENGTERVGFRPISGSVSEGSQNNPPLENDPPRVGFRPISRSVSEGSQNDPLDRTLCILSSSSSSEEEREERAEAAKPGAGEGGHQHVRDFMTGMDLSAKARASILAIDPPPDPLTLLADRLDCEANAARNRKKNGGLVFPVGLFISNLKNPANIDPACWNRARSQLRQPSLRAERERRAAEKAAQENRRMERQRAEELDRERMGAELRALPPAELRLHVDAAIEAATLAGLEPVQLRVWRERRDQPWRVRSLCIAVYALARGQEAEAAR